MKERLQKETATRISPGGCYLCRRRPTLPHTFACSTIGPAGLDFRVRDGNGYFPRGKITGFAGVCQIGLATRSPVIPRRTWYANLSKNIAAISAVRENPRSAPSGESLTTE